MENHCFFFDLSYFIKLQAKVKENSAKMEKPNRNLFR